MVQPKAIAPERVTANGYHLKAVFCLTRNVTMRACEKLNELFGVYVLGQARPKEIAQLEAHLAICESCREEVRAQQQIIAQLQPARLDTAARTRILRKLESARNTDQI
jgi:anti-sigma factor RsiW